MKLDKYEKNLLAIERFFNKFFEEFEGVTFLALFSEQTENYSKYFNPSKGVYPFFIRVETTEDNKTFNFSKFSWELGVSDDELPLYTKYGDYYGFHEIKYYVEQNLPEAFKGKSFYKAGFSINSDNIGEIIAPIKVKLSAMELEKDLSLKIDNTSSNKKPKI